MRLFLYRITLKGSCAEQKTLIVRCVCVCTLLTIFWWINILIWFCKRLRAWFRVWHMGIYSVGESENISPLREHPAAWQTSHALTGFAMVPVNALKVWWMAPSTWRSHTAQFLWFFALSKRKTQSGFFFLKIKKTITSLPWGISPVVWGSF